MLSKKMQEALNEQLNWEFYSAYLYLSTSSYFKALNLNGFASWMKVQVQEELVHAMKFYDYINTANARVLLSSIEGPLTDWDSPQAVFDYSYQHEIKVTGRINDLVNLAMEEKDHATNNFLQWFISEQVEEESSFNEVLQKLKLMGNAPGGLFMLDQEMMQRVFTPPPATGQTAGAGKGKAA